METQHQLHNAQCPLFEKKIAQCPLFKQQQQKQKAIMENLMKAARSQNQPWPFLARGPIGLRLVLKQP